MEMEMGMAEWNSTITVGVEVGVVLDMDTWLGKIGWSCISMALTDFYASHSHYTTRLLLNRRDVPNSDIVGAASAGTLSLSLSLSLSLYIYIYIYTHTCTVCLLYIYIYICNIIVKTDFTNIKII